MGRLLINDVKVGVSEGGIACGPVDGAVNVSVQIREDDRTYWLSNSEFEGIPNFYFSEDDIFDKLQSPDDDAVEELNDAFIDEFEGIALGEYKEIFDSVKTNEENPAAALIKYIILLTRCSTEDVDEKVALAKGKYVDELDIKDIEYEDLFDESTISPDEEEAEKLLKDPDKLERTLQRLEKKLKAVPVAGTVLAYVPLMISLVRSYVKKEYTDIPIASIIATIIALIYVLSPVDLFPDFIPGGYTDDAVIIAGCLVLIRSDLEDFRLWRKNQGLEFDDIPDYEEINKVAKQNNKVLDAFFKGKNNK